MHISFSEEGWSEYLYWQMQDKKTIKRINKLLQSIEREGALSGIGKPEVLKQRLTDYYKNLKSFYKKMMDLRKNCEKNDIYNVVIRPSSKDFEGGVYIENAEGKAQFGFFRSFRKISF